jgi:hypothetical protein
VRLAAGGWWLVAGGWRLAAGGWRLVAGGWRLAAGGWRLAAGGAEMTQERVVSDPDGCGLFAPGEQIPDAEDEHQRDQNR